MVSLNRKILYLPYTKYDFDEKDLYKVIMQDSEKNKRSENAVTL